LLRRRRRRDDRKGAGRHVGTPSGAQGAWTSAPVPPTVPLQRPVAAEPAVVAAASTRSRGKGRHRS
jgi:hypothetical protein